MGNNLSSFVVPDLSKVEVNEPDRMNAIRLAIFWAASLYGCAMIFSTCALVDRWKGPYDRNHTGLGSVLGAMLLSVVWPVVLVYLLVSGY